MKTYILILLFWINSIYSQSPAGVWYFGNHAGMSFNFGINPININDGQLNTQEGCATLCDNSGNLLFYTDGISVWNRDHIIMPNGLGLEGDSSSTQSAIIVPKPNSSNLFYVFTVNELAKSEGLKYSVIDLDLDSGFGDVVSKNVSLFAPSLEKITVVQHINGINYWIIAHKYGNNQFVTYELTPSGLISTPIVSSVGVSINNDIQKTIGYMKISPSGKLVAVAHGGTNSTLQLFNFDNATGLLTFLVDIPANSNTLGAYGIEFSSNSNVLYETVIDFSTNNSELIQFNVENLNPAAIIASKTVIASETFGNQIDGALTALQLAPNQKIYIGRNKYSYLSSIDNPNILGNACNYNSNAINLGPNICYFGLPSFISSIFDLNFTVSNFCTNNATQFSMPILNNVLAVSWDFGDINTSVSPNPNHIYQNSGTYTVTLNVQTLTANRTFTKQIQIIDAPIANPISNYNLCDEGNNNALFDLSNKNAEILLMQTASNYTISYHTSQSDADNDINPLALNYTNSTNPETVYARIELNNGNSCFDTTSFNLTVNPNPLLDIDSSEYYCINKFPELITLDAKNLNNSDLLNYLWSTNQISEAIEVNQAGIYSVTATNSFGCTDTRTITILESEIATINVNIISDIENSILVVTPSGIGNYVFAVDNELGNYQSNTVFNNLTIGDHILFVKDINGCGISASPFSIIGYPKFFTPNQDGINDFWAINGKYIDVETISIFDGYGKLLKNLNPKSVGWDGNYNGKLLPATDYWFLAKLVNGQTFKGHFSLKR